MITLMMDRKAIIARNFKRLRKERGWTQNECGEKGGTNQSYISAIEKGEDKEFGIEAEKKWAAIFGVEWTEFYNLSDNDLSSTSREFFSALSPQDKKYVEELIQRLANKIREGEHYIEKTNWHNKGKDKKVDK